MIIVSSRQIIVDSNFILFSPATDVFRYQFYYRPEHLAIREDYMNMIKDVPKFQDALEIMTSCVGQLLWNILTDQ